MSHDHPHGSHDHGHDHALGHGHHHAAEGDAPEWADPQVPDSELDSQGLGRRNLLRGAGLLGAGLGITGLGIETAAASSSKVDSARHDDESSYRYLSGDHHIHTQFSSDAMYRPHDQAFRAAQNGLDWMVITDHGSIGHAKIGVEKVNPDIQAARAAFDDLLVFQGLEWNIPAAEHATIIVTPGNEVAVLKAFENGYDGVVKNATSGIEGDPATAANELLAVQGLQWLASKIGKADGVDDAVMLANHPARKGLDTPHEFRAWRDQGQGVAIGMEGAPGHQAGGMDDGNHPSGARGEYGFTATTSGASAWAGYTTPNWEFYRTWGGFDPFTAMVGGLWDSLLSEGKPWCITANSDSHKVYLDPFVSGPLALAPDGTAVTSFSDAGQYLSAVEVAKASIADGLGYSDFFPGYYSRTHVGAKSPSYAAVLKAMRAGNIWVDHGQLLKSLDVRVTAGGHDMRGVTLGGTLPVRKGNSVTLKIDVDKATVRNNNGDLPNLAKLDVIRGLVTGEPSDKDVFTAPQTSVIKSYDVEDRGRHFTISLTLRNVSQSFYLRLRGSDGKRLGPGYYPSQDPSGPRMDVIGDANPWKDLWFYTNPIFVEVR